jgi:glycosyltransferase involved in cell wall biosynthesis
MHFDARPRVGYVLKRYPRFSESFIVREILAHEAAGIEVEIFALQPTNDSHFHELLSRVKAPVTYLSNEGARFTDPWAPAVDPFVTPTDRDVEDATLRLLASRLAGEVRRRGVTHLHVHSATAAAQVTRLAAMRAQVPYTMTLHVKDIFYEAVSSEELRTLVNDASAVVTVSEANRTHLIDTLHVDPRRLVRIYRGIDLTAVTPATDSDGSRHIVCAGRLVSSAGIADLLRACATLRDRGVRFSCDIVGAGPDESALRNLHEWLGLAHTVSIHAPHDPMQLRQLVASSALLVAPCLMLDDGDRDGLPGIVLTAMALGTAVVATDVAGNSEVVRHADTGVLVPPHDPSRMADGLTRLLNSSRLRRRLTERARAYVTTRFDEAQNAATLRDVFSAQPTRVRAGAVR